MKLSSIIVTLFITLGVNAAPASFDWRDQGIMTPVKNQEYCGSSYAFAGAGALEAYLKWKNGTTYDISEQAVVDCSYRRYMGGNQNGGCEGGWPTAVFEYFNQADLIDESAYPYTSGRTQRHNQCRKPNPESNIVRGKLRIQNVRPSEEQMKELLVSKGPLVVRMAADNELKLFFNDLGDGVFDDNRFINAQPNHDVILVGYGNQNGTDYWIIKNSWGTSWAMNGYGKIARGKNMCGLANFGVWYVEGI